jgi:exonuclease SbcC
MRLHSLRMRAFGPFAGEEEVDFDALSEAGLFLLSGPTGAGKTSILDGVCFALFGDVPGDRGKAKRLRSDHSPAGLGPLVILEVSLRGRRFRISRSPAWDRPSKRRRGGRAGLVRENASVVVQERVGDHWVSLTKRPDEAGDLMESLLGMNVGQFCQVALLPQGKFQTFLRAGADERHRVLERLFDTGRFAEVEDWLVEHRKHLGRRCEQQRATVVSLLDRISEVAGTARPDDIAESRGWAEDRRVTTLRALGRAREELGIAELAAKRAEAAHEEGAHIARQQVRHREATRELEELSAADDESLALRAVAEAARRATLVEGLLGSQQAAGSRLATAQATAREAVAAADLGDGATDGVDTESVRQRLRCVRDEMARLDPLRPKAVEAARLRRRRDELGARLEGLALQTTGIERERLELVAQRETLARTQLGMQAALGNVELLAAAATQAERVLDAATAETRLATAAAAAADTLRASIDAAQAAREQLLDLRQSRIDGMAAELAQRLTPFMACSVCGSRHHPRLARGGSDRVDADAERAANQRFDVACARRDHAQADHDRLAIEHAIARAVSGGVDPAAATARFDAARSALVCAESSLSEFEAATAQLEELERQIQATQGRAEVCTAAVERGRAEQAVLVSTISRHESDLEAATKGSVALIGQHDARHASDLEAIRTELARREQLLDRAVEALGAVAEAQRGYADVEAQALRSATLNGFPDLAAVRRAVVPAADLANVETLLRLRETELSRVKGVLADAEVVAASCREAVDLEALASDCSEADQACAAQRAVLNTLEQRADRLEMLCADLDGRLAAWEPLRCSHETASELAALCAGTSPDNALRMRLSAYVLAARLEQVVSAANERLQSMSGDRYQLVHTTQRGVSDRRGGLGLEVSDAWTGESRDPATLSGGETFLASLALALGLADVVAFEAGGAEIGTLFVDEGFGSLDPDTLDEVMDVLDGLRSGGRVVGVVSHVAEMRARITVEVHVVRRRAGSRLVQV